MRNETLVRAGVALVLGLLIAGANALLVAEAADKQMDQTRTELSDQDRDQSRDHVNILEPDVDLDQDRDQLRDRLDIPDQDQDQVRDQDQIHKWRLHHHRGATRWV